MKQIGRHATCDGDNRALRIELHTRDRRVVIEFGTLLQLLDLPPAYARKFAIALLERAEECDRER